MQLRTAPRVAIPTLIIILLTPFFVGSAFFGTPSSHADPGDETTYYLLTDHLGSVDVILDEQGEVVERRDYLPYGSERTSEDDPAAPETDHKFTGKELDSETGLHYYGARYYDAEIGRFVSVDPWGGIAATPQTLNKYTYTINNPIRFVDPTGKSLGEYQPYSASGSSYAYGEKMGEYRGIEIISAGSLTGSGEHPYQCTTLAKEFSMAQNNVNLGGTGHGYAYGSQAAIDAAPRANNTSGTSSYQVYSNSGLVMPQENDIISWSGGTYGHVGFIAEVVFDEESDTGQVYTIEQNASDDGGLFVQSLTRSYNDDGQAVYTVDGRPEDLGSLQVSGWAHYDNQSNQPSILMPNHTTTKHTPATKPMIDDDSE